MEQKLLRIAYILAFVGFCFCIFMNWYSDEKSKEFKWEVVSQNEVQPTSFGVDTIVTEAAVTSNITSPAIAVKTEIVKTTDLTESEPVYIDINTADEDTLCLLKGIGEKLAREIVSYREENGKFKNIEEIMNVSGIGEGIFANIHDFIYVTDPIYPEITDQPMETICDEGEEEFEAEEEIFTDVEAEPSEEITESETDEIETQQVLTLDDVAPIDLNKADAELLMYLPYVDEEIAHKIIELRENINEFSHPYELLYVEELTQSQVSEIIEYVYVENSE